MGNDLQIKRWCRVIAKENLWTVYRFSKEAQIPYSTAYRILKLEAYQPSLPTFKKINKKFNGKYWVFVGKNRRFENVIRKSYKKAG